MNHGLFEVVPGVYQVRGLDIANMTLIEGDSGVIVVDTLTSIEGARAAMELYFQHRGKRPVAAVIFTHTHTDHWGGARGVLDDATLAGGSVPIIAPNFFMEHAVSENIIAGPAMLRRAMYQFGPLLAKGVRGQVDCGLGKSMAAGSVALLRPTDLIIATGDRRDHRRRRIRIPDGAEQRGAGRDAFLHPALQAAQPRGKLHAQFPQSAAVPRRRRARCAGVVKISRRGPADVGRQGGRDVRPASLAGVGT